MRWFVVSLCLFTSLCVAGNDDIRQMQGNLVNNKELDAILERIAEIDASSRLNSLIDKIMIEDKGAVIQRKEGYYY